MRGCCAACDARYFMQNSTEGRYLELPAGHTPRPFQPQLATSQIANLPDVALSSTGFELRGKKDCKKMGVAGRECLPSVWQRDEGLGESYGAYGPSDVSAEASLFVTKELRVQFL